VLGKQVDVGAAVDISTDAACFAYQLCQSARAGGDSGALRAAIRV